MLIVSQLIAYIYMYTIYIYIVYIDKLEAMGDMRDPNLLSRGGGGQRRVEL